MDLFGGAIKISLPEGYFDASTIRQIPDNQEVWLEKDSDASLIIELVQIPSDLADRDAFAQFYWEQLSHDNAARDPTVHAHQRAKPLPTGVDDTSGTMEIIEGAQNIAKFNTEQFHLVHIWLAVLRLPRAKTDLLLTWNDPNGTINETDMKQVINTMHLADWSLFFN